jgi:transcriptional regulator with XRE-family HTH domain
VLLFLGKISEFVRCSGQSSRSFNISGTGNNLMLYISTDKELSSTIRAMTQSEVMVQAGTKLQRIRVRLGLSVREVQRRSLKLVQERQNRDYYLSKAWITDIEKGRFLPGIFKTVSLSVLYQLTIAEIHALYGIEPGDIAKERGLFGPPKTHLLTSPEESVSELAGTADMTLPLANTNLLTRLVDIWGDVPVPLLRRLDLRRCLYGYIGLKDRTMSPLLRPGTFVQIDAKQTRVTKGFAEKNRNKSQFARPIYFLDIRDGYACGWCEIKDGQLTFIPHPDSGEPIRTYRYPSEVEIVGRVTGIAMQITEESFTPIEETVRREPVKK